MTWAEWDFLRDIRDQLREQEGKLLSTVSEEQLKRALLIVIEHVIDAERD